MKQHDFSLYIHIPWCIKKCPYCDFNSYQKTALLPEAEYIECLFKDLAQDLPQVEGRMLSSIFFGGGTPSLFSPKSFENILSHVLEKVPHRKNIEITLEANPGTLEHKSFEDYYNAGINRISIGAQSFNNTQLNRLGRIHNTENIYKAIDAIKAGGFDNFNIDIMYGLPKQTIQEALLDLQTAIDLSPTHLSWYHLTIEPNTFFHHKPPILPNDDAIFEIQEAGFDLLAGHGFSQYEVSAFSKPGFQCHHNKQYWEFGDYLGIGAGAHGKIMHPEKGILRLWKAKTPKQYMSQQASFIAGEKILTEPELVFEFMLNTLRLIDGFPIDLFKDRTDLEIRHLQPGLNKALEKKLLVIHNNHIKPTPLGNRFLNDLMALFL